jgi:YidC/Oxa1 family membrane protein insertase
MESEKRLLIAIVLSLLVFLLYPYFMRMLFPPPPAEEKKEEVALVPEEEVPAVAKQPLVAVKAPEVPEAAAPFEEELITVETPLVKAVFTNAGGAVKSWELKNYRETMDETSRAIDIAATVANINLLQTKFISTGIPETIPFEPSKEKLFLEQEDRAELVFSWVSPEGIRLEKKYTFKGNEYSIGTELKISNGSTVRVKGDAESFIVASYEEETKFYHFGPVRHINEKVERQDPENMLESGRGVITWLGLEDKYFLLALVPEKDAPLEWETEVPSIDTAQARLSVPLELNPGESRVISYTAYLGPKLYDRLRSYSLLQCGARGGNRVRISVFPCKALPRGA